ncbi:MAG: hypothetical protein LBH60_05445 [Prevotellaceae bacterium]|nr:hypothetical protein [Prevotellaceae bacterium]
MKTTLLTAQLIMCTLIAVCGGAMVYASLVSATSVRYTLLAWIFFISGCYLTRISYLELREGGPR